MKTCVLFSGQLRAFGYCFANQQWNVFRKLDDPHFFVSVADDETAHEAEILRQHYPADRVFIEYVTQPTLEEPPEESFKHAPYFDKKDKYKSITQGQGLMRGLWSLNRVWDFLCSQIDPHQFEQFVLMRGDVYLKNWQRPVEVRPLDAYTTWWGNYGGVNGSTGVFGYYAALAYLTTYVYLKDILAEGCPMHAESLVTHALERGRCTIHRTLESEFNFIKDDMHETMLVQVQEIARYAADRAAEIVLRELRRKP